MKRGRIAAAIAAGAVLLGGGGAAAAGIMQEPAAGKPAGHAGEAVRSGDQARRHAAGHVAGKFERLGGPLGPGGTQPPVVPLSGTMLFARAGHRTVRIHVGKSGRFSVWLAPGRYRVSGRTPDILGAPGNTEAVCSLPGKIKVTAGQTRHIIVDCVVP